jgi:hypothetical protein
MCSVILLTSNAACTYCPIRSSGVFRFDYVADYGGELALCYQLWQMGITTKNLDYSAQPRKSSSYRLKQIVEQVFNLPFFRDVPDEAIEEARRLAPGWYRRYFSGSRLAAYEIDIDQILTYARSLGRSSKPGEPKKKGSIKKRKAGK